MEYPKSLYLHGWDDLDATVIVNTYEEEQEARKQGYKMLADEEEKPKRGRKPKEQ